MNSLTRSSLKNTILQPSPDVNIQQEVTTALYVKKSLHLSLADPIQNKALACGRLTWSCYMF